MEIELLSTKNQNTSTMKKKDHKFRSESDCGMSRLLSHQLKAARDNSDHQQSTFSTRGRSLPSSKSILQEVNDLLTSETLHSRTVKWEARKRKGRATGEETHRWNLTEMRYVPKLSLWVFFHKAKSKDRCHVEVMSS